METKFKITKIPENLRTIWVTYKKTFNTGPYGDTKVKEVVTEKGFYNKLFDHIAIPPAWRLFKGNLLPHGFGGTRLKMEEVIKWEYANEG